MRVHCFLAGVVPLLCLGIVCGGCVVFNGPADGCSNTCEWAGDGACDDGGPGSSFSVCDYGTDCDDCGARGADGGDAGADLPMTCDAREGLGVCVEYSFASSGDRDQFSADCVYPQSMSFTCADDKIHVCMHEAAGRTSWTFTYDGDAQQVAASCTETGGVTVSR